MERFVQRSLWVFPHAVAGEKPSLPLHICNQHCPAGLFRGFFSKRNVTRDGDGGFFMKNTTVFSPMSDKVNNYPDSLRVLLSGYKKGRTNFLIYISFIIIFHFTATISDGLYFYCFAGRLKPLPAKLSNLPPVFTSLCSDISIRWVFSCIRV